MAQFAILWRICCQRPSDSEVTFSSFLRGSEFESQPSIRSPSVISSFSTSYFNISFYTNEANFFSGIALEPNTAGLKWFSEPLCFAA